ncbi:MAG: hypothetical protein JF887_05450 [Candidatus Dormibacteraeota bacterium]|uniref:Uncharacterized protein n=1 Tax=Candidatus Amunia macphersoniae TaxID=3127014 RepID=A0A934KMT0_9BACT|nr:hypothetical protein [Candidatus Dormibacteraeota bacterium]
MVLVAMVTVFLNLDTERERPAREPRQHRGERDEDSVLMGDDPEQK